MKLVYSNFNKVFTGHLATISEMLTNDYSNVFRCGVTKKPSTILTL